MSRLIPALLACALAAACSSTAGGRSSAGDKPKGEPVMMVFVDYRTGARMELVNESHTDRLEQYSKPRQNANRKVQSDELMRELVDYLHDQGFAEDALPGDPPYMAGGNLRWSLQLMLPAGESYVAESQTATTREKSRLRIYSQAFLNTYNATQGWQAVKVEGGHLPFKGPNLKQTSGGR